MLSRVGMTHQTDTRERTSKSPSPLSAERTTGTTTSPTSQSGNNSSPVDGSDEGSLPQLPPQHQQVSFTESELSWAGRNDYAIDAQAQLPSNPRGGATTYAAAIKLLVSNNVAGSIIGRSGQTISELQKQSSTRIKLSQSGDFYPGTQDRVCLVQGEPAQCKLALQLLIQRLYMLQEQQHSQHAAFQIQKQQQQEQQPAFDFVVRLLVPMTCCGMIIGKSGSNIKFMEETTGVSSVRLSPKESEGFSVGLVPPTSERIVTITGPTMDSCLKCTHHIQDGMTTHPDISRYTNMTTGYSRMVADAYATPARQMMMVQPQVIPRPIGPDSTWNPLQQSHPLIPSLEGMQRRYASSPDLPGTMLNQRRMDPPSPARLGGFPVPLMQPSPSYGFPTQASPLNTRSPVYSSSSFVGTDEGVPQSASAPDLLAVQFDTSLQLSQHPVAQLPVSSASQRDISGQLPVHPPALIAPGCFNAQMMIPDNMIGSILGRGGSTLTELESLSGTKIRASQRGEFVPGTRSRIVTIQGPTYQAVWQAQCMINQRIQLPQTASFSPTANPISSAPHLPADENTTTNTDTSGPSLDHKSLS